MNCHINVNLHKWIWTVNYMFQFSPTRYRCLTHRVCGLACTPSTCWWLRWHMEFKKGMRIAAAAPIWERKIAKFLKRRFEGKRRRKFWGFLFGRFAELVHTQSRGERIFFPPRSFRDRAGRSNGCLLTSVERHLMLNVWTTYAVSEMFRTALRGAICRLEPTKLTSTRALMHTGGWRKGKNL